MSLRGTTARLSNRKKRIVLSRIMEKRRKREGAEAGAAGAAASPTQSGLRRSPRERREAQEEKRRKEAGHQTCSKSQLFFWNSKHEEKMQEVRRDKASIRMQTIICVVIIVGAAVNAAASIPARGPAHEVGMGSIKQRRNLVHTRKMGINKDVWQIPQVKEGDEAEGFEMFESDSHFERLLAPHKLTMDLKQMKWSQEPLEVIPDSGGCMQTREEHVDKWLAKAIRTIFTVAQGEWLVEMSKGLQLVPADSTTGQGEHYAIMTPWEGSSIAVRLDEKIPAHVDAYSAVIKYAIKCGCPIKSATGDAIFAAAANDCQAAQEIKQTYDKLVGYMASYNSRIEKALEQELPMVVLATTQHFGRHEFNAFGGVLAIKYALDEYGTSTQSARDEASIKLQKLVQVNITERRAIDVRNWLMIIQTVIVEWRTSGASSEMVEQFVTAPVLAQLENMKDTRDGMDQEQWRAIGTEANKWHKMRRSNNVEDHAGCTWAVVYSHLSKIYNELYGKGGLRPNVKAMRGMPSMPMNVAYGAMDAGEELSRAPTVPALEHMAFGAMTYTEFKELSDGQRNHAMMAAFNSPPATIDDYAKLIKGRDIQGGPGLLIKGAMSGQHGKIEAKGGGPTQYPRRVTADVYPTKKRTDEKSRVLRPQIPAFKCTHCQAFNSHYVTQNYQDATVAVKCSKCGKARKTVPVEGKAMAAAATSAAGKTPLTAENVQKAVVKALATQAPAAAAFAGMYGFERGNGFGLGEQTAFGASAEGVTADEASPGGVGTGQIIDTSLCRGSNTAATILKCIPLISVAMGLVSIIMMGVAQWGASVTGMGTEMVSLLRYAAGFFLMCAGACTCAAKMFVLSIVVGP